MDQWTRLPLSDLIAEGDKINYGVVQPGDDLKDGVPLVRVGDLISGEINSSNLKRISPDIDKKHKKSRLVGDEILIACVGSIGAVGLANPSLAGANIARALARIRCNDSVFRKYLYWYLRSPEPQYFFNQETRTVSQPTLNIREIEQTSIPLPPIAEQKRIAAILDKAEELRGLRRKALEELDAIVQSIFLEMFGDPVANPKNWERKPIKRVGQVITGNTPPRAQPELYGNAIEWIKSDNINTPYNYLTKASEGLSKAGKAVARTVPASSILVTCIAGTPDCIGNAAIADREVAFNQQINALVPQIGDFRFLYTQILVNKRIVQEASTSSMKGMVSKSRFEEIELIFPPVDMQQTFGESFDKIEQLKATHRQSLAQLDALFASLQHRAFRGEL